MNLEKNILSSIGVTKNFSEKSELRVKISILQEKKSQMKDKNQEEDVEIDELEKLTFDRCRRARGWSKHSCIQDGAKSRASNNDTLVPLHSPPD